MTVPEGNYLARVRKNAIEFPPPIRRFCEEQCWDRFEVLILDKDHLVLRPDPDGPAMLNSESKLPLTAAIAQASQLGEQSVMLRIEDGLIHVAVRKVFETLGFRPQ